MQSIKVPFLFKYETTYSRDLPFIHLYIGQVLIIVLFFTNIPPQAYFVFNQYKIVGMIYLFNLFGKGWIEDMKKKMG